MWPDPPLREACQRPGCQLPPWVCSWSWPLPVHSHIPAHAITVQCREGAWSTNTLAPNCCWGGCGVPTCAVVTELRNGVPCRCHCPPGRCEGKAGRQQCFRPWEPWAPQPWGSV